MPDPSTPHVLLIDDEPAIQRILTRELESMGNRVDVCGDAASARQFIARETPDAIVLDVRLPGINGDVFLEELSQTAPSVPVVMLTGHANVDLAVECMKKGASDLLTKPCSVEHLHLSIRRAIEGRRLVEENRTLVRHTKALRPTPKLVGSSQSMQQLRRLIGKVAPTEDPVLVIGESGTGKELVAAALQRQSNRAGAPFVTVNCAAVTETLLESELFGHEKGAFSGAEERRLGFFEIADGGTIFLDEIGDMPLAMQPKLLRVLQSGEFRRVGGNKTLYADVRIIAATNMDLQQEVREGRFREDLMHRINTFTLESPPLRERTNDIDNLVVLFSGELQGAGAKRTFAPEALAMMRRYPWPGNVRELRNVVRRALVLAEDKQIGPEDLPRHVRGAGLSHEESPEENAPTDESPRQVAFDSEMSLAEVEKRHILAMLEECAGNKTRTASRLGVSVKTLYNKFEAWQAEESD